MVQVMFSFQIPLNKFVFSLVLTLAQNLLDRTLLMDCRLFEIYVDMFLSCGPSGENAGSGHRQTDNSS